MKKENASHPVQIALRDWSKVRKANIHVNTMVEKTEHIPSLSVPSAKQTNVKCVRQVYILPH